MDNAPQMDPYATHLPMLVRCLAMTASLGGPVLELGMGNYSTRVLHDLCGAQRRPLYSYETDVAWAQRFMDLYVGLHCIYTTESWDRLPLGGPAVKWDVAFVDHGDVRQRRVDLARIADSALLVVAHDTEDPIYDYHLAAPAYKYAYTDDRLRPWTTVFSNFLPLRLGPGPQRYVKP